MKLLLSLITLTSFAYAEYFPGEKMDGFLSHQTKISQVVVYGTSDCGKSELKVDSSSDLHLFFSGANGVRGSVALKLASATLSMDAKGSIILSMANGDQEYFGHMTSATVAKCKSGEVVPTTYTVAVDESVKLSVNLKLQKTCKEHAGEVYQVGNVGYGKIKVGLNTVNLEKADGAHFYRIFKDYKSCKVSNFVYPLTSISASL